MGKTEHASFSSFGKAKFAPLTNKSRQNERRRNRKEELSESSEEKKKRHFWRKWFHYVCRRWSSHETMPGKNSKMIIRDNLMIQGRESKNVPSNLGPDIIEIPGESGKKISKILIEPTRSGIKALITQRGTLPSWGSLKIVPGELQLEKKLTEDTQKEEKIEKVEEVENIETERLNSEVLKKEAPECDGVIVTAAHFDSPNSELSNGHGLLEMNSLKGLKKINNMGQRLKEEKKELKSKSRSREKILATVKTSSEPIWTEKETLRQKMRIQENLNELLEQFMFLEAETMMEFPVQTKTLVESNKLLHFNRTSVGGVKDFQYTLSRQVSPEILVNIRPFKEYLSEDYMNVDGSGGALVFNNKILVKEELKSVNSKIAEEESKLAVNEDETKPETNPKLLTETAGNVGTSEKKPTTTHNADEKEISTIRYEDFYERLSVKVSKKSASKCTIWGVYKSYSSCNERKFDKEGKVDKEEKVDKEGKVDKEEKVDEEGKVDKEEKVDEEGKVDKEEKVDKEGKVDKEEKVDKEGKVDKEAKSDKEEKIDKEEKEEKGIETEDRGTETEERNLETEDEEGEAKKQSVDEVLDSLDDSDHDIIFRKNMSHFKKKISISHRHDSSCSLPAVRYIQQRKTKSSRDKKTETCRYEWLDLLEGERKSDKILENLFLFMFEANVALRKLFGAKVASGAIVVLENPQEVREVIVMLERHFVVLVENEMATLEVECLTMVILSPKESESIQSLKSSKAVEALNFDRISCSANEKEENIELTRRSASEMFINTSKTFSQHSDHHLHNPGQKCEPNTNSQTTDSEILKNEQQENLENRTVVVRKGRIMTELAYLPISTALQVLNDPRRHYGVIVFEKPCGPSNPFVSRSEPNVAKNSEAKTLISNSAFGDQESPWPLDGSKSSNFENLDVPTERDSSCDGFRIIYNNNTEDDQADGATTVVPNFGCIVGKILERIKVVEKKPENVSSRTLRFKSNSFPKDSINTDRSRRSLIPTQKRRAPGETELRRTGSAKLRKNRFIQKKAFGGISHPGELKKILPEQNGFSPKNILLNEHQPHVRKELAAAFSSIKELKANKDGNRRMSLVIMFSKK